MAYVGISGSNFEVLLNFRDKDSTSGPGDHLLSPIILAVLGVSSPDITNLLNTPLSDIFNGLWTGLQPTAIGQIQAAVTSNKPNAYGIQVSVPPNGTLRAEVGMLAPGMIGRLPPSIAGQQLTLSFWLPGFDVSFNTTTGGPWGSWADPSYDLKFDGELLIAVAVPDDPSVPLAFATEFNTQNAHASAGNLFALMGGIEDAIGNFFAGIVTNDTNPPDTNTPLTVDQLVTVFKELSDGFAAAARVGFRKLEPLLDQNPKSGTGNPAVALRITHPVDPAPVTANMLSSSGPTLIGPVMGISAPQVNAGGSVRVDGKYFPAPQANQLAVSWNDTTSGPVVASELQWGPLQGQSQPPQPTDVSIDRSGADGKNQFTAQNLAANTQYGIRVRDFDVKQFLCTDWSDWLIVQTAPTSEVQLQLAAAGAVSVVGQGPLANDGTFTTTATIPATVPPGTYPLWAVLGGKGIAQTTINVVAAGQALSPSIQIIDPSTGLPFTGGAGRVIGQVTVAGNHFASGAVTLYVDSATGQQLGVVATHLGGGFLTTVNWPFGVTGPHNVFAQQISNPQTLEASAPVFAENPPT